MLDEKDLAPFAKDHVSYEVWMLGETAARLATPQSDTVKINALLESFLLHARNLDDFLAGRRGGALNGYPKVRDTDVVAQDYTRDWIPTPALTREDRDHASLRVAHLTEFRTPKQGIEWQRISTQVVSQFKRFLATLEPSKRAWFDPN